MADGEGMLLVELFDITGKRIMTESFAKNTDDSAIIIRPTRDLEQGIYLIQVTKDDVQSTARFMVR